MSRIIALSVASVLFASQAWCGALDGALNSVDGEMDEVEQSFDDSMEDRKAAEGQTEPISEEGEFVNETGDGGEGGGCPPCQSDKGVCIK